MMVVTFTVEGTNKRELEEAARTRMLEFLELEPTDTHGYNLTMHVTPMLLSGSGEIARWHAQVEAR